MAGAMSTILQLLLIVCILVRRLSSYQVWTQGSNKKTPSYCASLATEASELAETKFGCKVVAVATDNEKKMEAMRKELKNDDPSLTVYGCASHWLNLLGQDVTHPQVINQIVEINKYFRNHHVPNALLAKHSESVKPQLPCATRWNSQLQCIGTYLTNRPILVMICAQEDDVIDTRIRNLINNVGLWKETKNLHAQLQPISSALDSLQSDKTSIADACEIWLDLLQNDDLHLLKTKIRSRFSQAMTPSHFLANLLHPKFQGLKLSPEQQEAARNVLEEMQPALLPTVFMFQAKAAPFPKSLFTESCISGMSAGRWWECLKNTQSEVPHDLCNIAFKLLCMPSSTASIERIFSNFGIVQSKLRNRLGLDKAAKLVTCY